MAVPPLIAAKAAGTAQGGLQKALTGDIYTRKWTEIVGKGKKAKVVEHEFRVNPVGLGLGAVAVGGAAVTAAVALWWAQLRLRPSITKTYKTIVDATAIPEKKVIDEAAWTEYTPVAEVGHYSHETVVVGTQTQWIGDTYIRGVLRPGHWITTDKVQDTGRDIWVVDIPAYQKKTFHPELSHVEPAVPAVTHQEETGHSKKTFQIEERKPFSFSDVADSLNPLGSFGKKPIFKPLFRGKWW